MRYLRSKKKKITTDIVGLLSRHDLGSLGVKNPSDVMRLKVESIKYGNSPLTSAAQRYDIDKFTGFRCNRTKKKKQTTKTHP